MKENHSSYREEIERSKRRLADLEERGTAALSRYDVEIAYGGNGERALEQAKRLVGNHLNSYAAHLDALGEEVTQLDLFGPPPAADVFTAGLLDDDDGDGMGEDDGDEWDDEVGESYE